ncbi:hypothetical protein KGF56_002054 [Candida oxycetoniae]|uniref:Uncharacterized protein n=1 Tax=Candida oxycetoniae TaxID=497107 RepID=A0AAI9SYH0_9ASCO|nr:uncharacterized protein KGF56_002054 [Candida oxycetoniae]KAI3405098.2 hypothetical protein KGF56_002054 [Candida oxycetoniae]
MSQRIYMRNDSEPALVKTSEDSPSTSTSMSYLKSHYVIILILVIGCFLLFHFRFKLAELHDRYRTRRRMGQGYYTSIDTSSFQDDINDGLNSASFDLEANNLTREDPRNGLDEQAKEEIKRIMKSKSMSFDEARLEYVRGEFAGNNIDENGVPKDPKLVTLSS